MARILTFGSSTTYGLYGGPEGGWADRLKTTFSERDFAPTGTVARGRVFNLAASGLCLPQIVEYLPADIQRHQGRGRTLGVFMVGDIESAIIGDGAVEPKISPAAFQKGLTASTEICHEYGVRQLFVGMPYADDTRSVHSSVRTEHELRRMYDKTVQKHAEENDLPFVDTYGYLENQGYTPDQILADDGQHPNALGHALIHKLVLTQIDNML